MPCYGLTPTELTTMLAAGYTQAGSPQWTKAACLAVCTVVNQPTIIPNLTTLCNNATTLTITGTYFTSPYSSNTVTLTDSLGNSVTNTITSGTTTSLILDLTGSPIVGLGYLYGIVSNSNGTSSSTIVAKVIDCGGGGGGGCACDPLPSAIALVLTTVDSCECAVTTTTLACTGDSCTGLLFICDKSCTVKISCNVSPDPLFDNYAIKITGPSGTGTVTGSLIINGECESLEGALDLASIVGYTCLVQLTITL